AGGLSRSEFAEAIAKYPAMARYERVKRYQQSFDRQEATAEGKPFTDFEIEYNGTTHRLSDVVGHGDYVLVDYWASWCGPCIRQTAVIKDIYNEYKDKGLKVLGVAVWDEPDATLAAIEKHQLPWECWLNGQSIPTDLYGIMGIPCIILYGPDGTILSRDKQSDELKAAVRAAIDKN
ncbi:MAG: TlpA family protein disulfide reductase, partial [Muribaculaceae bacterium]|nr:TlpA family protein disulfide reductase [Muribaculaceae bacterium]